MLKVGDKFSARAHGSNHRVGLDYKRGDLFELVYIGVYSEVCTLKHLKSGVEFKENQYRLETDFKKYIENEDQRFIVEHLAGVDEVTLSAIKLLVAESVGIEQKPTIEGLARQLDAHTQILKETVELVRDQQGYFDKQIKAMKYKAHLHGISL